jgi:hypothetical protein
MGSHNGSGSNGRRTVCPVSRDEFRQGAQPVTLSVGGQTVLAPQKEFSTGSLGWYASGKLVLSVAGKPVTVQLSVSLTLVGSKELE